MDNEEPVIAACEAEWDTWKSDCSGFAKAVAARLGIQLSGSANLMVDYLEGSGIWQKLGTDTHTATFRALQGYLVIGGLKATGHGHVVVVVKSPPLQYPVAYWGRFGAIGRKNTTINWSWNKSDLHKVHFYARMP